MIATGSTDSRTPNFPSLTDIDDLIERRYHKMDRHLILDNLPHEWEAILDRGMWSQLRKLFLGYCRIGDENYGAIVGNGKLWPELTSLSLFFNQITYKAIKGIFLDHNFSTLQFLQLRHNSIGCKGVQMLVKAHLPALTTMNLDQCGIGSEGARTLSKGVWKNLNNLDLHSNHMAMDGFEGLADGNWSKLRIIYIYCKDDPVISIAKLKVFLQPGTKIIEKTKNSYFKQYFKDLEWMKNS